MTRFLLMAMAIVVVVMAAGCYDLPADLNCPPEPGPRLVVRGDSLGAFAETTVKPGLAADHDGPVCYVAAGGTQINNHSASLPLVGENDCVIMELGTNDISNEVHQQTEVDMHAAADELSDARAQVWFTLNTTGGDLRGTPYSSRTRWFNDELLRMAESGQWPNMIVWRWDLAALGHPEWLNLPSDKLHMNTTGVLAYAASMRQAAATCPWPPPPPPPTTTTVPESTTTTSEAALTMALVGV